GGERLVAAAEGVGQAAVRLVALAVRIAVAAADVVAVAERAGPQAGGGIEVSARGGVAAGGARRRARDRGANLRVRIARCKQQGHGDRGAKRPHSHECAHWYSLSVGSAVPAFPEAAAPPLRGLHSQGGARACHRLVHAGAVACVDQDAASACCSRCRLPPGCPGSRSAARACSRSRAQSAARARQAMRTRWAMARPWYTPLPPVASRSSRSAARASDRAWSPSPRACSASARLLRATAIACWIDPLAGCARSTASERS